MNYSDYIEETKQLYAERLELVMERIASIKEDPEVEEPFADYFRKAADYLCRQYEILKLAENGKIRELTEEEGRKWNDALYGGFRGEAYEQTYACHTLAAEKFGSPMGQILAAVFKKFTENNADVYSGSCQYLCIYSELLVELHMYFRDPQFLDVRDVKECLRSFMHDYSELFQEEDILTFIDPEFAWQKELVMQADLSNDAYLYGYGLPVGDNERQSRRYLETLSEDEIRSMADTMTEGYRIGFEVTGKDISVRKIVPIGYPIGFERMIRAAVSNFEKLGLQCTFMPYTSAGNKQMSYDHREDVALWTDKKMAEYRIECRRNTYEKHREPAGLYGGPMWVEVFGEVPFTPQDRDANPAYDDNGRKIYVYWRNQFAQLNQKYLREEGSSYSIIAYPLASIGDRYEEIFRETVKLNTLDYTLYRDLQQKLIDVLDTADYVHVQGMNGNRTDIYVKIWDLKDPARETAFENCVADVNIPLGEVFTSPVLEGTHGKLHVTQVYLEEYSYRNLELDFKDGMIDSYTCTNFENEEQNKKFIEDNILYHHPTLPMGEFAIGTNTEAYRMGKVYQIQDKLPILIAEKTGPHFAVGDTCYSYEEDSMSYNPDGKAIVARENSVSALRNTDPGKAYLNCHTDITIPYNELGAITVIRKDGTTRDIIRNGRFVVEGCELLNQPLDELGEC